MSEPPAPKPSLVALRDRRDQVIAALTEHFAGDILDVDEFDRRIDLAHRARTVAELDELVTDLAPLPAAAPTTALVPRTVDEAALARWPKKKRWLAIMGGFERKGRWTVPQTMRVVCLMGGASIDFREAEFAPGVTELRITAVMGGLEIVVPPWLAVDCDASAIMGGFEHLERGTGEPDPGRPLLRITGLAVMGGVSIQTRLPGESERDARKRAKKERKALAEAARDGLPRAEVRSLPAGRRDDA